MGQVPGVGAGSVVVVVVGAVVVVLDAGGSVVVAALSLPSPPRVQPGSNASNTSDKTATVALTPTCVWRISSELVLALDERLGDPLDAYVNGSQVWLRDDGPSDITIEWRLHPVAGYQRPKGVGTYEVFPGVALALATGGTPAAAPEELWDGLEAFPAHGDEIEPAVLAATVTSVLGLAPDAAGLADHQKIGDEWERSGGKVSIVDTLLAQLSPTGATEL